MFTQGLAPCHMLMSRSQVQPPLPAVEDGSRVPHWASDDGPPTLAGQWQRHHTPTPRGTLIHAAQSAAHARTSTGRLS